MQFTEKNLNPCFVTVNYWVKTKPFHLDQKMQGEVFFRETTA